MGCVAHHGSVRCPARVKNRPNASRAQLRHRQSFVTTTKTSIAYRKRRAKLSQALDLPTDKASLRAIADRIAGSQNMIIPISEQANVPGGLMSLDAGTVPGKRPPGFGRKIYTRLPAMLASSSSS